MEVRELWLRRDIVRAVRGLHRFPRKGRVLPEFQKYPDLEFPPEVRELIFSRLARVFYRYDERRDTVFILGISFRGQDVSDEWLSKLLEN